MENPTVGILPEGHTTQVLVEASEGVALTAPSLAVVVPAEIAPPETPVATSALAVSVVSTTLVREDPPYIPCPVIEKGSGSFPGGEDMGELARQMVQQFFTSMGSCIDLILRGSM